MIVRMLAVSVAIAGALVVNGCATTSTGNEEEANQVREYRTGSNLPSRDSSRVKTISGSDVEQIRTNIPPTGPIRSQ
jgi:outer membrane lipoprotein SlyB